MSKQRPTLANLLVGMAYLARPLSPYHLLEYSAGANPLFGYSESIALNNLNAIIHPDDLLAVDYQRQIYIQNKQPYDLEYRIITQDQQIKYVHDQGQLIEVHGESFISGFISDVTNQS